VRLNEESAQLTPQSADATAEIDGIRAELVKSAAERRDEIAELWLSLREDGPTYGDVGSEPHEIAAVANGYLRPLARLLSGALAGPGTERTLYLDERTRFFPQGLTAQQRRALVDEHLEVEIDALSALLLGETGSAPAQDILRELHQPLLRPPDPGDPRLLLIGDCLMADTRLFLGGILEQRSGLGLDIDHISFNAGWRTLEPEDIARRTTLVPPALIALSLFTYEGIPAYNALIHDSGRLRGARLRQRVEECVAILGATLEAIREVSDAPLLIHSVCGMPIGPRRIRNRLVPAEWPSRKRLIREMTAQIAALVNATENAMLIDEDALIRQAGGLRRVAGQLLAPEYLGAWFHPSRFGPILANEYADVLTSVVLLGKAKVLLVDLDNTLWKGVMAEGDVVHDRDGQKLLKQLREAGVLLVALSKNDPTSIRWDEMELSPEDFVLHKIDWRPKPEGVSEAVVELDLAADAFVLLDDNPVERALVEENVPGVRTLDPTTPFAWRSLRRWLELPSTKLTPEAQARTQMYREAATRRQAMGAEHNYDKMMESLELRAEIRMAKESDLDRLVELIQRTNQFNTTTRRHSVADIRGLLASSRHAVHVASLADRFGDLGIVAVAIVEDRDPGEAEIDSFIMSCRAMGFGLEQLLLNELTTARAELLWRAAFIPTERNGPAASLYPNAGFESGDGELWRLAPGRPRPPRPGWFA
jgi:FkbH-like protein